MEIFVYPSIKLLLQIYFIKYLIWIIICNNSWNISTIVWMSNILSIKIVKNIVTTEKTMVNISIINTLVICVILSKKIL